MELIVVSDLDGTLLDHHDYSFAAILPVLDRMDGAGIPLIINTSKTRAEWLAMRKNFGNPWFGKTRQKRRENSARKSINVA